MATRAQRRLATVDGLAAEGTSRPGQLELDLQRVVQPDEVRQRSADSAGAGLGPRLALSPDEAAAVLGVSRDYLDEHVIPELRVVRRGRRILIAVTELEHWLDRSAVRATVVHR
jgi:excisionase family DNA binding protein